jgi:hypothetical protein
MPLGTRSISRSTSCVVAVVLGLGLAVVVTACSATQTPSGHQVTASGFPSGAFAKEVVDPELGRVRLVWRFEPDGRWAEIPLALDGQTLRMPTVRGSWVADAETVTVATDYPPGWGTSTHGWRLDGDRLWTFFKDSDVPDDKEWFESLDSRPWVPSQ